VLAVFTNSIYPLREIRDPSLYNLPLDFVKQAGLDRRALQQFFSLSSFRKVTKDGRPEVRGADDSPYLGSLHGRAN
jgi:hypothetical protein